MHDETLSATEQTVSDLRERETQRADVSPQQRRKAENMLLFPCGGIIGIHVTIGGRGGLSWIIISTIYIVSEEMQCLKFF